MPCGWSGRGFKDGLEDEGGGALGFDGVGVGRGLHGSAGAGAFDRGFTGHDGAAGDRVGGEEDGERGILLGRGASFGCGAGVDRFEALGECFDEGGLFGPTFDEGESDGRSGGC